LEEAMKYMLMFCGSAEYREQWERMPADAKDDAYTKLGKWFGENADRLVETFELQPPSTAKTVRIGFDGSSVVTDGPFIEAKEVIGGYAVFDVSDEAAALELARQWPAGGTVEVRAIVER
jgi:hypothetical protein